MMWRRKGYLGNILLIIIALLLLTEIFLPRLAERKIRQILENQATEVGVLQVDVGSFPALKILAGRLDRLEVRGEGITADNLKLKNILLKYKNVHLSGGTFTGENTALNLEITEKALNDYLKKTYQELEKFQVKLQPEQVYLAGKLNFLGTGIDLQLTGRLQLNGVNQVSFIPEDISLQDIRISLDLLRSQLGEFGFSFDLNHLGIPLRVEQLELQPGLLIARGNGSTTE